jgi:NAD(P)-dependent dehydrogenase (short-subunit alcohol dehydrogenase family)
MKVVVVTGSTRGIGFGLAREFLKSGCRVVISGRKAADVAQVIDELSVIAGKENVDGLACDVSDPAQVQALWDKAFALEGYVDIWVNNAGIGQSTQKAWEVTPETTRSILRANVEGTIHGCSVAMRGMIKQGSGTIYNMEGLGSDGRHISGLSNYGTSKAAVRYFSQALMLEAKATPVTIGTLQPGMVMTEMLSEENVKDPAEWKQMKTLYNFLGDTVPNVTRWLVKKMLENNTNGRHIKYLTLGRMLQHTFGVVFRGRDVLKEALEEK